MKKLAKNNIFNIIFSMMALFVSVYLILRLNVRPEFMGVKQPFDTFETGQMIFGIVTLVLSIISLLGLILSLQKEKKE